MKILKNSVKFLLFSKTLQKSGSQNQQNQFAEEIIP